MKKRLYKIMGVSGIVIGILLILIATWWKGLHYNPLTGIPNESIDIPNYIRYETITYDGVEINMRELLNSEGVYHLREVFVIKDGKVYFVYTDRTKTHNWVIASVNLKTGDFEQYCVFKDPNYGYGVSPGMRYEERDGFYLNGQIVLNDGENVLVYDIDSKEKKEYIYAEYDFPECKAYCSNIDGESIVITMNGESKVWTLEDMLENSNGIAQMYELTGKLKLSKEALYVHRFFSEETVQCIEDRIYLVGKCMNYHNASVAVILEYDLERNEWMYVTSHYVGDVVFEGDFYLIPEC